MPSSDRRAIILEALDHLIRDGGSPRVTIADVADRAGLSRATLYREFAGGKEELLASYTTRAIHSFADVVCSAGEAEDTLEAAIAAMITAGRAELLRHDIFQSVAAGDPQSLSAVLLPLVHVMRLRFQRSVAMRLAEEFPERSDERRTADAVYIGSFLVNVLGPAGAWNLDDPDEMCHLVRTFFTAGVGTDD